MTYESRSTYGGDVEGLEFCCLYIYYLQVFSNPYGSFAAQKQILNGTNHLLLFQKKKDNKEWIMAF